MDKGGNSLMVQWLGLHSHCLGSIPGWGTEVLQAAQHTQKKKTNITAFTHYLDSC